MEQITMPLEIAIQKELTYRKKVTSSSIQTLKQQPLSSILSSSPSLSGSKRKELINPHEPPLLECQNLDKLYCKVCKLSCSSPFNLTQHLMGRKHKSKLKVKDLGQNQKNNGMLLEEGRNNQMRWCELCKVPCMTEDLLNLHLKGKKHRAELQKFEMSKEEKGGGEIYSHRKWCELCKIWCIDMCAFKQHLEGKKHLFQVHIMEKNKKLPDMLRPNCVGYEADEMVKEARNMELQAMDVLRSWRRSSRVREKTFKLRD